MLSGILSFFVRNFSRESRKRSADEPVALEPHSKLAKLSSGIMTEPQSHELNSNESKENLVDEKDEVSIIGEVSNKRVLPRRSIRRSSEGKMCSSTPQKGVPLRTNQRVHLEYIPSPRTRRIVEAARKLPSNTAPIDITNDEVEVIGSQPAPTLQTGTIPKTKTKEISRKNKDVFLSKVAGLGFRSQCRQASDLLQYRQFIEKLGKSSSCLMPPYSFLNVAKTKPLSEVPLVDLTNDVKITRAKEEKPSTVASKNVADTDVINVEEGRFCRINSFKDYLNSRAKEIDLNEIIDRHRNIVKEKRRLAQLEETRLKVLSPHNKKSVHDALEERIRLHVSLTEPVIVDLEEDSEEYVLPKFTEEDQKRIKSALMSSAPREVLAEKFGLSIARHDMTTLKGVNWLNDEVINFYMNLLMERGKNDNLPTVYAFNTFFYPKLLSGGHSALKRWTRKVDLFSHEMVFVPIHLGMHWCMAVIDFPKKEIRYYDSMLTPNNRCLNALLEYLKAESLDKKKTTFDSDGWELINVEGIPPQLNSSDCGVFACTFAEHLARKAPLKFSQGDMPYFREKMVLEILNGTLLT